MATLIAQLQLPAAVLLFTVMAAAIWLAGTRLSYLADAIGAHIGVGHAIMGVLFLAGVTELPELVTTASAAIIGDAALALNNMFGGITMQTAVLAVADAVVFRVTLTSFPRRATPMLEGTLLVLLLSITLIIVLIGDFAAFRHMGIGVIILAACYVYSIHVLWRYEDQHAWRPVAYAEPSTVEPRPVRHLHELSLRSLTLQSIGVAAVILVCGVTLVEAASNIAERTGLGSSFVGVTLLAATTSLPELSTTIAAVRMGAYTMAISNIFGSNLLMVFIILPADFFYSPGAILDEAGDSAQLALLSGIAVTSIYIVGLLIRRKPRWLGMGLDSLLVLGVYLLTLFGLYVLR